MRFESAAIAQSVEHVIGNDEVMGPNPISSSNRKRMPLRHPFSVGTHGIRINAGVNDTPGAADYEDIGCRCALDVRLTHSLREWKTTRIRRRAAFDRAPRRRENRIPWRKTEEVKRIPLRHPFSVGTHGIRINAGVNDTPGAADYEDIGCLCVLDVRLTHSLWEWKNSCRGGVVVRILLLFAV